MVVSVCVCVCKLLYKIARTWYWQNVYSIAEHVTLLCKARASIHNQTSSPFSRYRGIISQTPKRSKKSKMQCKYILSANNTSDILHHQKMQMMQNFSMILWYALWNSYIYISVQRHITHTYTRTRMRTHSVTDLFKHCDLDHIFIWKCIHLNLIQLQTSGFYFLHFNQQFTIRSSALSL